MRHLINLFTLYKSSIEHNIGRRVWIQFARDLNDRCCLKVYFTDVNKKGVLKYKTNNETVQTTQTDK